MIWIKIRIKRILRFILTLIPVQQKILFESNPDFTDNTYALYQGLKKKGYNRKYKMIWYLHNQSSELQMPKEENILFCNDLTSFDRIKTMYHLSTAKYIITNQTFFSTSRKNQIFFYLTHGIPMKGTPQYNIPGNVDYCLATSECTAKLISQELKCDWKKMIVLGYPRNDQLFEKNLDLRRILGNKYKKVIVWYPTYRQHKARNRYGNEAGIPLIDTLQNAIEINKYASNNNVLLIVKPHPAQDISYIDNYDLSNILMIDDSFFQKIGVEPYRFLGNCDALLSDYSSIYFDYLLCDKPIGLIWSDIKLYKEYPGLIDNYEYYASGAEIIYDSDQLKIFIEKVANNVDDKKSERNELKKKIHLYNGRYSERVVNWMEEELGI